MKSINHRRRKYYTLPANDVVKCMQIQGDEGRFLMALLLPNLYPVPVESRYLAVATSRGPFGAYQYSKYEA